MNNLLDRDMTKIRSSAYRPFWWLNFSTGDNGLNGFTWRRFFLFALPGLSYAIQNNMVYFALVYLDPPTFQVF
eukprot:SAG31_NODE_19415_length_603_cov_0.587302_1_plen_72_part_10